MAVSTYTQSTPLTENTELTQNTDCLYWIWFQLVFGFGTRRSDEMMRYFSSPKDIYDGIGLNNNVVGMLSEAERQAASAAFEHAKEIKRRTLKKGVDIITPDSTQYPELLRQIYSKPAVLYVKGDLTCLEGKLAIAMVGTREHTEYGVEASAWIAKGLVKGDAVVVSGLAHGIDTECHMAALTAGGKSIGVLGCGIDVDYPKGNAKVKRLICENGAVVTEFPLGTEPRACNFPIRNRIVSGMCHGVAVIEAEVISGSLLTARHAMEQGRDVFAVPGSIFSAREQGTHKLINDGAKLISDAQDIFDEYENIGLWKNVREAYNPENGGATSYSRKNPMKNNAPENLVYEPGNQPKEAKKQTPPDGLEESAIAVYDVIGVNLVTVDQISEETGLSAAAILSALTELEIYGLIQVYPGRKFGIIPVRDS